MKNYNPSATWEPLVWQSSEEKVNVYNSWEGCPTSLQEGAQFLGTGKVLSQPLVVVSQVCPILGMTESPLGNYFDLIRI